MSEHEESNSKLWQSDKNVIYCRWIWDFRKMYFRRRAFYFSALKREWAEPNVMVGWKGAFKKKYRALTNLILVPIVPLHYGLSNVILRTSSFQKEITGSYKFNPGLLPLVVPLFHWRTRADSTKHNVHSMMYNVRWLKSKKMLSKRSIGLSSV